jgi:formamidopyrimidine-DNA glycosylase
MPELPEVECVRRGLARARLTDPITKLWRSDKALRTGAKWRDEQLSRVRGARPVRWTRRGKFLVWQLRREGDEVGLLVHLGMTGRLGVARADAPVEPHTHLRLGFDDGRELRFVDPRRFGGVRAASWSRLWDEPPLAELGPEPLTKRFDGRALESKAGHSRRALCDVLLDQRVVAGVGNIYAQEALFEAGLHPLLRAERLRATAWDRLAVALVGVLRQGVRNGGTTFRDYRDAAGRAGRNQAALRVYGRAGCACLQCGATLRRYVHSGRSGAWCPEHQRRPGSRRVD